MIKKTLMFLAKKIKGKAFVIDSQIPTTYFMGVFLRLSIAYIRGVYIFKKTNKFLLVESGVTIYSRNKIIFTGKSCRISKQVYIDALSVEGITFGENVSIQKFVTIECTGSIQSLGKGLKIGNNVGIGANSFLGCAGGVVIGDDTIIGNFVSFHSENHNFELKNIPIRLQGVTRKGIVVGKNCWIGAKVTILDGTVLGDNCIVAAGAVLTGKNYGSDVVIAGVPARVIKEIVYESI